MELTIKSSRLNYAFVILVTLTSIRLWSFHGIPDKFYDALELLVLVILAGITVINYRKIRPGRLNFNINVHLLLWLPVLSAVGAWIYHGQSIDYSMLILRTNFFWLLYFVLHILNIPPKAIIRLMVAVGVVWILLTIIQQFTYPSYWFYTRNEDDNREIFRAGVYRFMLYRHHYGLFIIFYFYTKFLRTRAFRYLIPVFFGLLGFYYFGTRQFAVGALVCIAIASISYKGSARFYSIVTMALLLAVFLYFKDVLFSDYIQLTTSQLQSDDDIRVLSAGFFLFEYWPHWSAFFLGNGMPHAYAHYGKEIISLGENKGYYRGDVGIIGTLNMFGILYVLNVLWICVKGIESKLYSANNRYLKLFFINTLLLLILSDYFAQPSAIPFFCFVFYLLDKSYAENKVDSFLFRWRILRKLNLEVN